MSIGKREWEQSKLAGASARQNGRPRTSCPLYGMGRDGELRQEAWYEGWDEADEARAKQRKVRA